MPLPFFYTLLLLYQFVHSRVTDSLFYPFIIGSIC